MNYNDDDDDDDTRYAYEKSFHNQRILSPVKL